MRCYACNVVLTDQEATRKFKTSASFTELCSNCLHTIDDQVEYTQGNLSEDEENLWDERDE